MSNSSGVIASSLTSTTKPGISWFLLLMMSLVSKHSNARESLAHPTIPTSYPYRLKKYESCLNTIDYENALNNNFLASSQNLRALGVNSERGALMSTPSKIRMKLLTVLFGRSL